jgi:hypothetical protein
MDKSRCLSLGISHDFLYSHCSSLAGEAMGFSVKRVVRDVLSTNCTWQLIPVAIFMAKIHFNSASIKKA